MWAAHFVRILAHMPAPLFKSYVPNRGNYPSNISSASGVLCGLLGNMVCPIYHSNYRNRWKLVLFAWYRFVMAIAGRNHRLAT